MSDSNGVSPRSSRLWLRPVGIWAILVVFALASLAAAYASPGAAITVFTLGIAAVMVVLLWLFLMDLARAETLVRLIAAAGLLWLSFMFALTSSDYLFRRRETPLQGERIGHDSQHSLQRSNTD